MARRTARTSPAVQRLLALTAAAAAVLGLVLVAAVTRPASSAPVDAAGIVQPHNWRNVEIAGGGFVPGIVFSPAEKDLIYARTDIGGAYRWNQATGRWIPLLDWVDWDNWGYNGVASIAPDPKDADKVYAAVGMYTNSWDPNNGAILRSADRGKTWQHTRLPFKVGGNMPGRGMGERLSVDPNDGRVLYFGAPSGKGLWRSTDSGVTWSQVTSFPNPGNYVADPDDPNGYGNDIQGVVWVTYDPRSATAGSPTRTIYVGVADMENTVYRSTDAGATWSRLAGQPTGYIAHQGELDTAGGFLYLATSDTGGPYDGGKGDVWKYDTATGAWTRISPVPSSSPDSYFGYSGLTLDRQDPGTLMVATQISWWPDVIIFRSTDGGATWTRAWDFTSYPNRSFRYTMDISAAPWLSFGENPQPPEVTPKLGWMVESLEIDPFDSNRMLYGTGATIYGTTDLLKWDDGGRITIEPTVAGLEETAVLDLISPPEGAPLISGLGDIGGFRHTDLTKVPEMMFQRPYFTTTRSLDYAEKKPAVMVRSGDFDKSARPDDMRVAFSTDGGENWFQGTEPAGVTGGGTVAAAADGSRFVWSPAGAAVHYSVGFGTTWTPSTGLPAGAVVESDRVNPLKFYALAEGRLYTSTDGGATFTAGPEVPAGKLKAVPGHEGDLWLTGDTGLFRSEDSGATVRKNRFVTKAVGIGFGKPAEGKTYPTMYAVMTTEAMGTGVFRIEGFGFDGMAAGFVHINTGVNQQYGNMGEAITGDPRVYGRVYLGTNGRGILVADPAGGISTTHATTTTIPTSTSTTSSSSTTSTTVTDQVPPACAVRYQVTSQWGGGFTGSVKITNRANAPVTGWRLGWSFPNGQKITNSWNGKASQVGAAVTVTNEGWNGTIAAGSTVEFGFQASWQGSNAAPTGFTLNGRSCSSV
ncbi:cellulose binding domain-containing protein [Saccharothrix carnea]|uniref:Cellulose binding domain-containing protein n=1 Tax=Saccharothrix carnea TaxID=1280637 RepID=A0A2P8I5R3_SACCR|nr:cellulose binding domain-containing protein [Saccharothrix carnea]PSL53803.1 cellulose binding domain-containing protein [Saccharothrix carnea]